MNKIDIAKMDLSVTKELLDDLLGELELKYGPNYADKCSLDEAHFTAKLIDGYEDAQEALKKLLANSESREG